MITCGVDLGSWMKSRGKSQVFEDQMLRLKLSSDTWLFRQYLYRYYYHELLEYPGLSEQYRKQLPDILTHWDLLWCSHSQQPEDRLIVGYYVSTTLLIDEPLYTALADFKRTPRSNVLGNYKALHSFLDAGFAYWVFDVHQMPELGCVVNRVVKEVGFGEPG